MNNHLKILILILLSGVATLITAEPLKLGLIYYTNPLTKEIIPHLARHDILAINRFNYDDTFDGSQNSFQQITNENPDIGIYVYQTSSDASTNSDLEPVVYIGSVARYRISRNHSMGNLDINNPDLYLFDQYGNRVETYSSTRLLMDVGSPGYQSFWLESTVTDVVNQDWKATGIFADNCMLTSDGTSPWVSDAYDSNQNLIDWNSDMSKFMSSIASGLHEEGQRVVTNTGGSRYVKGAQHWLELDNSANRPDIIMEEAAFVVSYGSNSDAQFYPEDEWKLQIDTYLAMKNMDVWAVSHVDMTLEKPNGVDNNQKNINFYEALWFAMASTQLAKNNDVNLYMMFGGHGLGAYQHYWWFDEYEIDLGETLGDYKVLNIAGTSVYYREFSGGRVYVNPTVKDARGITLEVSGQVVNHDNFDQNPLPVSSFDLPAHRAVYVLNRNKNKPLPPQNLRVEDNYDLRL